MLQSLVKEKWDYTRAAHLLNRAGFGGAPAQVAEMAAMGPEKAVTHLVDFDKVLDKTQDPEWAKPDSERAEKLRAARNATPEERRKLVREEQQKQRGRMLELRHWWLHRMAFGPRPLQEKLTLFWHGHFATSVEKVRDAYLMWRQNELFRRLAAGNWLHLLTAVAKDPAMLVWLDQAQSRKEHPNENFAREVMELFALGEGHYTEKDITEGARALTGWSYDRVEQKFIDRPSWHDSGTKVIFGKSGDFGGEDFLRLIVIQPQASRLITTKLWTFFAGEPPSEAVAETLATLFRQSGYEFKPVLRAMFLSEDFYSPSIIRNQVKSPVQWLVGSVLMLERELPPPLVCLALTKSLGQDLFAPPNVKGWDGGVSWITTNTLLTRYNEALTLVAGDLAPLSGVALRKQTKQASAMARRLEHAHIACVDVEKLFSEQERANKETLLDAMQKRLLQSELKPKQQQVLVDYLKSQSELNADVVREALRLVMSTPEYQLT